MCCNGDASCLAIFIFPPQFMGFVAAVVAWMPLSEVRFQIGGIFRSSCLIQFFGMITLSASIRSHAASIILVGFRMLESGRGENFVLRRTGEVSLRFLCVASF